MGKWDMGRGGSGKPFQNPATIQGPDIDPTSVNVPVMVRGNATYGSYRTYADGSTQGRYISSSVVQSAAVALTTATSQTIVSLTIPKGKWMLAGAIAFMPAALTSINRIQGGISKTTNVSPATDTIAVPTDGEAAERISFGGIVPGGAFATAFTVDGGVIELTEERTYYLVAFAVFTLGTLSGYGSLQAVSIG